MTLKHELEKSLLQAMKSKDGVRKNAIRMAISSIKLAEVENGGELEDVAIFGIIQKEIKTREETIAEAEKAGRPDMIPQNKAEIEILKDYLPKELSDEELTDLIKRIIDETGASSIKEMGIVMKVSIQEVQGRASNDRISKLVREILV